MTQEGNSLKVQLESLRKKLDDKERVIHSMRADMQHETEEGNSLKVQLESLLKKLDDKERVIQSMRADKIDVSATQEEERGHVAGVGDVTVGALQERLATLQGGNSQTSASFCTDYMN